MTASDQTEAAAREEFTRRREAAAREAASPPEPEEPDGLAEVINLPEAGPTAGVATSVAIAQAMLAAHQPNIIWLGAAGWFYYGPLPGDADGIAGRWAGWNPLAGPKINGLLADAAASIGLAEPTGQLVGQAKAAAEDRAMPEGWRHRAEHLPEGEAWDAASGQTVDGIPWVDAHVWVTAEGDIRWEPAGPDIIAVGGNMPIVWAGGGLGLAEKTPAIDALMETWFPAEDERRWAEGLIFGRAITACMAHHALPILYGPGGAGKTSFLDLIGRIIGPRRTFRVANGLVGLASQYGLGGAGRAQLILIDEIPKLGIQKNPAIRHALETIKAISGGQPHPAEAKYEQSAINLPPVTALLAGNHPPLFLSGAEDAEAWARRIHLFTLAEIPAGQRKDNAIADLQPGEISAFARRCVHRFAAIRRAKSEGKYESLIPAEMIARRDDLMHSSLTPSDRWFAERVSVTGLAADETNGAEAWASWADYAHAEGIKPDDAAGAWRGLASLISRHALPPGAGRKRRATIRMDMPSTATRPSAPSERWTIWHGIRLLDDLEISAGRPFQYPDDAGPEKAEPDALVADDADADALAEGRARMDAARKAAGIAGPEPEEEF